MSPIFCDALALGLGPAGSIAVGPRTRIGFPEYFDKEATCEEPA